MDIKDTIKLKADLQNIIAFNKALMNMIDIYLDIRTRKLSISDEITLIKYYNDINYTEKEIEQYVLLIKSINVPQEV